MPNKRINMRKIRETLRLRFEVSPTIGQDRLPGWGQSTFTATANSFELLGLASRHGIGGTGSGGNPQKTMNRSEAMTFIWTICQRYLRRTRVL